MDKNTTVVFPAPLMTTIAELGSFLAGEKAAAGLPAITLFPLWPRAGQPAGQVILQARRRGAGRVLPGLILHEGGGLTAAAEAVLRQSEALPL